MADKVGNAKADALALAGAEAHTGNHQLERGFPQQSKTGCRRPEDVRENLGGACFVDRTDLRGPERCAGAGTAMQLTKACAFFCKEKAPPGTSSLFW